ncbi:hypothetical protein SLS64_009278 [Diaporthe eres]|uniref:Uncharacterized protein n=1 Tax=Diaporthe eres TaxID=83184 RepID=A0ABR1PA07_DIAER
MYNPKLITLGLAAATALPAMAMLPVEKRSESAVDLGMLQDMDSFFELLGFDGNTTWETIEEPETHDWAAIAAEDAARVAATTSNAPTAENIGLATRQEAKCTDTTGFTQILCENMPTRAAWWATGGALAIWYGPEVLVRWTDAIAHVIVTARSLRQMKPGNELGRRAGEAKQYKFSVPAALNSSDGAVAARSTTNEDGSEMSFVNHYIFEEETGIVHYQGTRAALAAEEQAPSALRGVSPEKRQTHSYSIVIQATALSSATTLATQGCVSSMVKWHINRATESNRFKCVPLDNRGSWKFALHVNINKGLNNNGEKGECCDF